MRPVSFHLHTALAQGMRELFAELSSRLALRSPLTAYLAGGMAVHLYTGKRVTTDVDAEFSARVLIPNDVAIEVVGDDGQPQLIYIDTNYNPMFALLHANYQQDAIAIDLGLEHIRLRVLSPVDLAVSKLARFAEIDREDIRDLVRLGIVSAAEIETRGNQALQDYIGNRAMVQLNLRDAITLARTAGQPAITPADSGVGDDGPGV
jgi:hypothetical protein